MRLLIVESPAKAKKIQSILHSLGFDDVRVVACCGHVRDLDKKKLSVDVDNDFSPEFVVDHSKLSDIIKLRSKAMEVWLGSDNDMEGEAISWHLREILGLGEAYKRITFNEITERALQTAVLNPKKIDMNLVEAQMSRRLLDRLVGFTLSPILWNNIDGKGLSAGRVQSAALKMLCDKERDVAAHVSSPYWTVSADFQVNGIDLNAKLCLTQDGKIVHFESIDEAKALMLSLKLKPVVTGTTSKTSSEGPPAPFITSSLQQAASKCRIPVQQTMKLAQVLYEHGLITYMRTDCCAIAQDALDDIEAVVTRVYGTEYHERRTWDKKKVKGAQEAHEAIRPTDINVVDPEFNGITQAHKTLYTLIRNRTLASQMANARYIHASVNIIDKGFAKENKYVFSGHLMALTFPGWKAVYGEKTGDSRNVLTLHQQEESTAVKYMDEVRAHNTWTMPPQRHTEANLVKVLESEGIGRPSTYATIIDKLTSKGYASIKSHSGASMQAVDLVLKTELLKITKEKRSVKVGDEKSVLTPTDIGMQVNEFLEKHVMYIVDKTFTSNMESELDTVAHGTKSRLELLRSFWETFSDHIAPLQQQKKNVSKTLGNQAPSGRTVIVNGIEWIVREARYGPVLQNKDKYIGLTSYMKEKGIDMGDIGETDVRALTSYPCVRGDVTIAIGPYGAYLKKGTQNFTVPPEIYKKYGIDRLYEITDEDIETTLTTLVKKRPTSTYKKPNKKKPAKSV